MRDPKLEFGPIRVLGTSGWIVAGLLVGSLGLKATSHPLQIAALSSVLMGLYCFTLPHTPPLARADGQGAAGGIFPKESLSLLKERSMAVFAIASFLICIPLQFYYAFTNLFLNQSGVSNAAAKMSAGQFSQLFCMLLILLHGICYDFFFVTGQIYIDLKAPAALRAAAQGLISLITYGAGMFVGSWLSGAVVEHFAGETVGGHLLYRWRPIWIFSAAASCLVLVAFLLAFRDTETEAPQSAVSEAMQEAPL
jgi:hypothetical protein